MQRTCHMVSDCGVVQLISSWTKGVNMRPVRMRSSSSQPKSLEKEEAKSTKLANFQELLGSVKVICFDCDGVLFHGKDHIADVPETLQRLQQSHKVFFVTNNSTKSRQENVKKLESYGIKATKEQILNSAFSAAHYLYKTEFHSSAKNKVYMIGEQGIYDELKEHGIESEGLDHGNHTADMEMKIDEEIGCVVVGLDKKFNYYKLAYALIHIQRGAQFIATNCDSTYPAGEGLLLPGAGSIVSSLEKCAHKAPLVMGKPSEWFITLIQEIVKKEVGECDDPYSKVLMIGDRLDTDIEFGKSAGFKTLLVTKTGVNNESHLKDSHVVPDFYTDKVTDFLPCLRNE